jgi:hypothetical protein
VRLKEPMDVILAYWTAEGLGDGRVRFRGDAYGRDAALLAALGGEAGLRVKLPPPAEPEPVSEPVPGPVPPGTGEPVTLLGPTTPTEAKGAPVTQVREPEVAAGASAPGLPPVSRL